MTTLQLDPDWIVQAPGRGRYDRRQPREERLSEQRARLLSATALACFREKAPTIASVVRRAGVSRNTFYEYFDDLEHAAIAAGQRALSQLVKALRAAEAISRTPVERWRALARAWFEWIGAAPPEAMLCLANASGLSNGGREFEAALARSLSTLRAAGLPTRTHDDLRITATASAAETFARHFVERWATGGDDRGASEAARVERALVDVAVRLLR